MARVPGSRFPLWRKILFLQFACLFICAFANAQQRIVIRGSETLIYLGQRFAGMYQRTHSGSAFEIHGGGIDQALRSLSSCGAEVAQVEGAIPQGRRRDAVTFPVGVQAIVVYVNASNSIRRLTLAQLRSIFLGETTNWKALGGADRTIHLYAGESTTGILDYFQEFLLGGQEPYPFYGKNNTKALLEEIAAHPEGIGYGSLDSRAGVRIIAIAKGANSGAVVPSADTIRSRRYPITRFVTWMVPRESTKAVREFCAWLLSSEGQLVVEAAGFQPLLPADRAAGLAKLRGASTRFSPVKTSR